MSPHIHLHRHVREVPTTSYPRGRPHLYSRVTHISKRNAKVLFQRSFLISESDPSPQLLVQVFLGKTSAVDRREGDDLPSLLLHRAKLVLSSKLESEHDETRASVPRGLLSHGFRKHFRGQAESGSRARVPGTQV